MGNVKVASPVFATPRARSLAWLERPADNRKVASPNLAGPTFDGLLTHAADYPSQIRKPRSPSTPTSARPASRRARVRPSSDRSARLAIPPRIALRQYA